MPNIYEPEYDVEHDGPEPYVWRRSRLGRMAGSERLGASLFALPPGSTTFPLHAHLHNEELLVVIAGTPTLRTGRDASPTASYRPARSSPSRPAAPAPTSSATTRPNPSPC